MTWSLPAGWDRFVVVIGGTTWDGIWMSERHLAIELSEWVPVLWVDFPTPWPITRGRESVVKRTSRPPLLRSVAPRMIRMSPTTLPGPGRPGLRELASWRTRQALRRVTGSSPGRVLGTLIASVEAPVRPLQGGRQVFYGTDDFAAGASLMGVDRSWVARRQREHLARADDVVVVSPALQEAWAGLRSDLTIIPNGCDPDFYAGLPGAAEASDVRLPRPIAGVVGQFSDRLDLAHLEAVADQGLSLLLIGPRHPMAEAFRFDALVSRPNVQWVGEKGRDTLPGYLSTMEVGLTPYADDAFNRASFPLKTLEYLSAGLRVVATDLPAARWLDTDLVSIAQAPHDFARATAAAMSGGLDDAERVVRRQFATGHSWRRRAQQIAPLLGVHHGMDAPVPAQIRDLS